MDTMDDSFRNWCESPAADFLDNDVYCPQEIAEKVWKCAQQASKAGEWKGIESAPRDGTWIIGAELNSYGKWMRYITFYTATMSWSEQWLWDHDEESEYCPAGWFKDTSDEEIVTSCKPTHWQPLSAPPSDAKQLGPGGELR